jgi:hypothetical protein
MLLTVTNITTGVPSAYGAAYGNGDVIGVALDMDAGTLVFYKNGVSQGTAYSSLAGTFAPASGDGATNAWTANFGQRPFAYTAPSGFKALVTTNLPEPTVVQGDDYFNTVLYTGTGSSLGVTGVGFQPDWVWIKERSGAADHGLYDAVRGVTKQLESNTHRRDNRGHRSNSVWLQTVYSRCASPVKHKCGYLCRMELESQRCWRKQHRRYDYLLLYL